MLGPTLFLACGNGLPDDTRIGKYADDTTVLMGPRLTSVMNAHALVKSSVFKTDLPKHVTRLT